MALSLHCKNRAFRSNFDVVSNTLWYNGITNGREKFKQFAPNMLTSPTVQRVMLIPYISIYNELIRTCPGKQSSSSFFRLRDPILFIYSVNTYLQGRKDG